MNKVSRQSRSAAPAPAGNAARTHILGVLRMSPLLAALHQQGMQSQTLLDAARPHLPQGLADSVAAGAFRDGSWCLIAPNAAVAAKLRHCLPGLLAALQQSDCEQARALRIIRVRVARADG